MNEKKKMIIIGIIVLAIVSLIPITAIFTTVRSNNVMEKFEEYIKSSDLKIVYIGRDDCGYCQLFAPEIELIKDEYGIDYLYINTNDLKDKHFDQLLEKLEINSSDFGTPYLVITKDGKKVSEHAGYLTEKELFDYLKEQKLIEESASLPVNYIDYADYEALIASDSNELVLIAQSGCSACTAAKPIIYDIAKSYDFKMNILNISNLSEDEATEFQSSLDYFTNNGISTPTLLVVSNNEVVDAVQGATTKENYVSFLKEYKFINE